VITEIPGMFVLAFLLGLTGALVPGPMLVATIDSSLRGGWLMGPKVVFGHMAIEFLVCLIILMGLAGGAGEYSGIIAFVGGIALIAFGVITIRGTGGATIGDVEAVEGVGDGEVVSPVLAGFLTSAANPYFWIWWLTIGSGFLLDGLRGGVILAMTFMAGHWTADLSWYTVVSVTTHRGKSLLSDRNYRLVLLLCGIFLIVFGGYYLLSLFFGRV